MSMYQPLIPTGSVGLNLDYQNIQNNFQQLNTTFGQDHTTYDDQTTNNGYHKVVHMIQQLSAPATVADVGQLYPLKINDGFSDDTQLFFKTALGKAIQLTLNFVPRANTRGYTMLPGGLMLQWGSVSVSSSTKIATGNVSFSSSSGKNFINNCYNVSAQLLFTGSAPTGRATVAASITDNTGFAWTLLNPDTASYNGFYWTAIGN